DAPARLATWVARTDDIGAARAACGAEVGEIEPMTRGALSWRITIPADGSLPCQGAAPTLIQWDAEPHPASALPDAGCALEAPAHRRRRRRGAAGDLVTSRAARRGAPCAARP